MVVSGDETSSGRSGIEAENRMVRRRASSESEDAGSGLRRWDVMVSRRISVACDVEGAEDAEALHVISGVLEPDTGYCSGIDTNRYNIHSIIAYL